MNKNLIKTVIILIAVAFVTLQSCEKKAIVPGNETGVVKNDVVNVDKAANLSNIEFIEGMLVFESPEEYNAIINNVSYEELQNWENKIGFVSQQSILESALNEESKYFEQFDPTNMTEKEIAEVVKEKEKLGYTEFTKKYINSGLIRPYINEDISSLELTVESKIYPGFLNLDGMVKIGNIIYQYTPTQCKQITDGDFNKVEMLKLAKYSNKSQNIKIGNLISDKSNLHIYLAGEQTKTEGRKRIITYIKLRIYDYGSTRDFYYYLGYKNYKKNIWGNWKEDSKADTNVSGRVKVTVQGESGSWFYVNYSRTNLWSDHIPVTNALPMIPSYKTVTFSSAGFTFKRDNVSSVYRTHPTRTF